MTTEPFLSNEGRANVVVSARYQNSLLKSVQEV